MTHPLAEKLPDTYEPPEHGWVCFHCGEHFPNTFAGQRAARDHFGEKPLHDPACHLRQKIEGETKMLRTLRAQERELSRYRAEDSDKDRQLQGMAADHATALIREEEKGYAKGLADGRQHYATELDCQAERIRELETAEAEMRERAAAIVSDARGTTFDLRSVAAAIRALPLQGEKE